MQAVLTLRNASKTHPSPVGEVHALLDVSLEVYPGELVAVMGPSGSGKSTLLNTAGGLDAPTSGEILVGDTNLVGLPQKRMASLRRRDVGFIFQDLNLIPALTAAENAALPMELDGTSARAARRQAIAALTAVGMTEMADRYPEELSGGQQQRVAIARALIGERKIVLADEPTGALDSVTGEEVLMTLRGRCDEGAAVLLVTHDSRHAAWADRIVNLRDGKIVDIVGDIPSDATTDATEGGRA